MRNNKLFRNLIMIISILMLNLVISSELHPVYAATSGWSLENGYWVFYKDNTKVNGWLQYNNSWYFLSHDGEMQTSDIKINGKRWHFTNEGKWDGYGYVDSNSMYDKNYDYLNNYDTIGYPLPKTNWQGKPLAVEQPQAVVNETLYATQTTDGWLKTDSGWQYLVNVKKVIGWKQIDGKWYDFNADGIMLTNTIIDGKYKIGANGVWDGKTYAPSIMEDAQNREDKEQKQVSTVTTDNSAGTISYDEFTKIADATMLNLVNAHRADNGSSALTWDTTLAAMSTEKSNHMIKHNYFSHDYNNRGTMTVQSIAWKYSIDAENILANYSYPITSKGAKDMATAMFKQWEASAGHNSQMLNVSHTRLGFGFAFSKGKAQYDSYATQQFANADDMQYEVSYTGKSLEKYLGGLE